MEVLKRQALDALGLGGSLKLLDPDGSVLQPGKSLEKDTWWDSWKYLGIEGYTNFYTSHEASAQPVKAALGHPGPNSDVCPIQPNLTQFHLFIDIFDIGDTPTCVG